MTNFPSVTSAEIPNACTVDALIKSATRSTVGDAGIVISAVVVPTVILNFLPAVNVGLDTVPVTVGMLAFQSVVPTSTQSFEVFL